MSTIKQIFQPPLWNNTEATVPHPLVIPKVSSEEELNTMIAMVLPHKIGPSSSSDSVHLPTSDIKVINIRPQTQLMCQTLTPQKPHLIKMIIMWVLNLENVKIGVGQ